MTANSPTIDSPTVDLSVAARYARGIGMLGRGWVICLQRPGLLLLGWAPAALVATLLLVGLVLLLWQVGDLAATLTWFAADWSAGLRRTARVVAGVALVGAAGLLAVLTFTSLTLRIGSPCYTAIARRIEGAVPDQITVGWWRGLARNVTDSLRLLAVTALFGIVLFVLGFLPVLGQTVIPAIGASLGGWMLALQLVAVPFDRRGLRLADRRRALRRLRPEALGFGTAVFVCFLLPGGAVLFMPAAVAGGTILAQQALAGAGHSKVGA